ncbi:MAG: Uma2 family endonuclease [Thiohalorhabdaceae bacterium]
MEAKDFIRAEDYLEGEKRADQRHEYVNGRVYARVGASKRHNLICLNLVTSLREATRGGPCQVYMVDVKVHIHTAGDERFYYPDLVASCDPAEETVYYTESPRLVVEVLSESSERADREEKSLAYRTLTALEEYVLVAQDDPRVEVYRRAEDWRPLYFGPGGAVPFASLETEVSVAAVYAE